MAFYGWPFSQCQSLSTPLTTQLNDGIRVIDIRLAVIPPPPPGSTVLDENANHQLIAYHGIMPQRATFLSILKEMHDFLTSPIGKRETIVMTLKQEDFVVTPAPIFSALVKKTIMGGPGGWEDSSSSGSVNRGMWFLENRIPTLGEVRGKVVMVSRFGGDGTGWDQGLEGIGIHPTTWPDSRKEGFEWELKGVRVRTHDWYVFLNIEVYTTHILFVKVQHIDALCSPRKGPTSMRQSHCATFGQSTHLSNHVFLKRIHPIGFTSGSREGSTLVRWC